MLILYTTLLINRSPKLYYTYSETCGEPERYIECSRHRTWKEADPQSARELHHQSSSHPRVGSKCSWSPELHVVEPRADHFFMMQSGDWFSTIQCVLIKP